jgi:anti-sigma factor RsiW
MTDPCSSVSTLLEKYHDREVTEQEKSLVEKHLTGCPVCREIVTEMEQIGKLLRAPVQEAAEREDFAWVWQKVQRGIRQKTTRWSSLRSWIGLPSLLQKKVWVPALATAVLVLSLILGPAIVREYSSPPRVSAVEYVESPDYNVMIYEGEKGNVVIWLFDGSDQEAPAS